MNKDVMRILPTELRGYVTELTDAEQAAAEEIRLRIGFRPAILLPAGEKELKEASVVSTETLQNLLERATDASPYAFRESLSRGYLSCGGGVRIGLCGEMSEEGKCLIGRTLTSAAIRIPHEVIGCGEKFAGSNFSSTLILSPPGLGKTTLLRDMIRALSASGYRIGVADARGEIAAFSSDGFGFSIGQHTDVITHCGKYRAAMMLLRTMNPQILAMDEITEPEDAEACLAAANSGVLLLASAHAASLNDLRKKPIYKTLSDQKAFSRTVVISIKDGQRFYQSEAIS